MSARTDFQQLVLMLAATVAIPMAVLVAVLTALVQDRDREQARLDLLERAVSIREAWRRELADTAPSTAAYTAFCRQHAGVEKIEVVILSPRGLVVGDSHDRDHPAAGPEDEEFQAALAGEYGYGQSLRPGDERPIHAVAIPLRQPGGEVVGVLRLSESIHDRQRAAPVLVGTIVIPITIALVVLMIAAAVITQRFRRDIEMIAQSLPNKAGWTAARWERLARTDPVIALHRRLRDEQAAVTAEHDELARENRQWAAFFTSMREGIVAVDHEQHVIAINEAARDFLGLPQPQQLVGEPLANVRQASLNQFVAGLLDEQPHFREGSLEVRRANGDRRHYHLSGVRFPYQAEDQPGVLVVLHDITTLKRLEDMRKEFVGNVSHELKTPVTAIRGFVETLQDCVRDDPDQAAHFLGIIQRHADRINAIIDDLLMLSRLEQDTDDQRRQREARSLRQTTVNAVNLVEEAIRKRRVEVDVNVPADSVYANHRLLEQAIANLLSNAVKYAPEGSPVRVGATLANGHVDLFVQDEGPGIAREHHHRIFERFYRVDKSRDRQTGGTGLGLAIVKHIARLHDGNVSVDSRPGAGATFHLRFPRHTPDPI